MNTINGDEIRKANYATAIETAMLDFKLGLKTTLRCCPNCEHFDNKLEVCKLAATRPPAKIIAFGCERFEFDIPF